MPTQNLENYDEIENKRPRLDSLPKLKSLISQSEYKFGEDFWISYPKLCLFFNSSRPTQAEVAYLEYSYINSVTLPDKPRLEVLSPLDIAAIFELRYHFETIEDYYKVLIASPNTPEDTKNLLLDIMRKTHCVYNTQPPNSPLIPIPSPPLFSERAVRSPFSDSETEARSAAYSLS